MLDRKEYRAQPTTLAAREGTPAFEGWFKPRYSSRLPTERFSLGEARYSNVSGVPHSLQKPRRTILEE